MVNLAAYFDPADLEDKSRLEQLSFFSDLADKIKAAEKKLSKKFKHWARSEKKEIKAVGGAAQNAFKVLDEARKKLAASEKKQ